VAAKSKPLPASIQKDLDAIREKAPRPPPPPVEEYLKAIYQKRRVWNKSSQWRTIRNKLRAHAKANLHRNVGRDSFRILIALTSPHAKPPTISKYMTILKYARKKNLSPNQFLEFYNRHGSVNNCVAFIRNARRSGAASSVRRVPRGRK
jgi:hypothetical protein